MSCVVESPREGITQNRYFTSKLLQKEFLYRIRREFPSAEE